MKEQIELIVQCDFSKAGENLQELLLQSFQSFLARKIETAVF